jgi:Flp pilus assembly protein TadD
MMNFSLLQQLGSLVQRKMQERSGHAAPAQPAAPPPVSDAAAAGGATALADPIVATVTKELAAEQPQPVPTEDEQLQAEQHPAWANYDFERCIVIFSRLLELHPDDPGYKEKLVASTFNRGKQYEAEGNDVRATQLDDSALAIDSEFGPAQEAAQQLLDKNAQ